jgi:hypothetical protein
MSCSSRLVDDLRYVFDSFPLHCLEHLRDNARRLVRNSYSTAEDRGCIFYLLSERLPEAQRIHSKQTLIRYYGGDAEADSYQPPKWIVRLWDEQICENVRHRYGSAPLLSRRLLLDVLNAVIDERQARYPRTLPPRESAADVERAELELSAAP